MNPYTQGNPFTSQLADIGYAQNDYQAPTQNTGLQDQFHNAALSQMQQLGSQQPNWNPTQGSNPLALAMALKKMGGNSSGMTPQQTWDMTYGTQASPYTGGATFGADAAQSYDFWK
mgnify:CR=1 FL=1